LYVCKLVHMPSRTTVKDKVEVCPDAKFISHGRKRNYTSLISHGRNYISLSAVMPSESLNQPAELELKPEANLSVLSTVPFVDAHSDLKTEGVEGRRTLGDG